MTWHRQPSGLWRRSDGLEVEAPRCDPAGVAAWLTRIDGEHDDAPVRISGPVSPRPPTLAFMEPPHV